MLQLSTFDTETGARTLAQEARGEPDEGQRAVAWVLRNRLASGRWGKSLSSVCLWNAHIHQGGQGFQFSGWRGQDPNFVYACGFTDGDPILQHARDTLAAVMAGPPDGDPTGGAMWYYAASIEAPTWTQGAVPCGKFGNQFFFRGVK